MVFSIFIVYMTICKKQSMSKLQYIKKVFCYLYLFVWKNGVLRTTLLLHESIRSDTID